MCFKFLWISSSSSSSSFFFVFFCFFYTAIVFNPADTADNLKKHGGFIPGIRPGKRTADYLDYVLTRLTFVGAGYLAIVCLLPELALVGGDTHHAAVLQNLSHAVLIQRNRVPPVLMQEKSTGSHLL